MKRYADLIGNYKKQRIKSLCDNNMIIDSDYRGPVIAALKNTSNEPQVIDHGMRIAQLVIQPYIPVLFQETSELSDTARGSGGFGSTGTK